MNTGIQTVDLHGCTVYQAKIVIDAQLKRAKGIYRIRLIHGCHHGTALMNMIRKDYRKHPKILRLEIASNSETDLVLREW